MDMWRTSKTGLGLPRIRSPMSHEFWFTLEHENTIFKVADAEGVESSRLKVHSRKSNERLNVQRNTSHERSNNRESIPNSGQEIKHTGKEQKIVEQRAQMNLDYMIAKDKIRYAAVNLDLGARNEEIETLSRRIFQDTFLRSTPLQIWPPPKSYNWKNFHQIGLTAPPKTRLFCAAKSC
ncbi:hypothetical protein BDZ45DRAFT_692592 [Acephala macrosclerotiorum]|nr:hypothetical protein BDZ45DRAFT_692592 [Acephala macrosclerotiorum]